MENNSKANNGDWKMPVWKILVQKVGMENAGMKIASKSDWNGKCQFGASQYIIVTVPNLSESNNNNIKQCPLLKAFIHKYS